MIHKILKLESKHMAPNSRYSEQIAKELGKFDQGLYVFLFENLDDTHIMDSNTKPKIVVHKHSAAIKPGKFENTFRNRFYGYEKDMRFNIDSEPLGSAFIQSFHLGYVLELPNNLATLPIARIFERYWIEEIFQFLEKENVLSPIQNKRAEWRQINPGSFTTEFSDKLQNHLKFISNNISLMLNVISSNEA